MANNPKTPVNVFLDSLELQKEIKKKTARAYAMNYRASLPQGKTLSVWFDKSVLERLTALNAAEDTSGIRIYFARYDNTQYSDDPETPIREDYWRRDTVIIAATKKKNIDGKDINVDIYYENYGSPCPPSHGCQEDETLFKDI